MSYYRVNLLDKDGCEIGSDIDVEGLKASKTRARELVAEYPDAHKAEVLNDAGECVYDTFQTARFDLYWSPTGQKIASAVTAVSERAAIRKAPTPYNIFKGEIYAIRI